MKTFLGFLIIAAAWSAQPISMVNTKAEYGKPAIGYATCHYTQTLGSGSDPLRVRVVVEGMCPHMIKYDPVTGTWSRY